MTRTHFMPRPYDRRPLHASAGILLAFLAMAFESSGARTPDSVCTLGWGGRGAWRSLVSALVWGTRGPEFESRRPD
jgi:hypothetical protein